MTTKEVYIEMLKRECVLRKSAKVQQMYDEWPKRYNWYPGKIEDFVQLCVLKEFKMPLSAESLTDYRGLHARWPGDPEIREAAFFIKENIIKPCPMRIGDIVPNIVLHGMDGTAKQFPNDFPDNLVVIASSST